MEAPQFSSASAPFALLASPERRGSLDNYTYKAASAGNIGCGGDQFVVEDLLDLPTDDAAAGGGTDCTFDNVTGSSTDSSTVTATDSGNSCRVSAREPSFNGGMSDTGRCGFADGQFSADLCVPYEDMAELEWLSNFVEESFSSDDQQNLHLISGMSASETAVDEFHPDHLGGGSSPMFHSDKTVPAKARSKRSRAAPCNWTSRLLMLSSEASSPEDGTITVHAPEPPQPLIPPQQAVVAISTGGRKTSRSMPKKKHFADGVAAEGAVTGREARRCLHCETDTTPQWRTGPTGPKTLCNACGVRYKSGRLVPEYRPAASPTFVLTKHSNSHRKVMELRRQKEMMRAEQQQPHQPHQFLPNGQNDMVFDTESVDGYLIHQHVCPDFRHLI